MPTIDIRLLIGQQVNNNFVHGDFYFSKGNKVP